MKKGLVSIVLPIYNVEKYLDRCMNSVVNQSYKNLEIIMVDDGSKDASCQICDEWQMKDNRVKVIHKENQGLGMARNTGIENATGEYICFVDSDDYIALDTIERLYSVVSKEDADVVTYGYRRINQYGEVTDIVIPQTSKSVYVGNEVFDEFLPDIISRNPNTGKETWLWMSACAAMFSLQLITQTKWRFVSEREIISEDVYSLLWLYRNVSKVCVVSSAFYNYCENDTISLTRSFKPERFEQNKFFYKECIKASDILGYSEEIRSRLSYPFLGNTVGAMKRIAISDCCLKNKIIAMKQIINDDIFCTVVSNLNISKETTLRKILYYSFKKRYVFIAYVLIYLQARKTLK